jgi:hypothetical protein
MEGRDSRTDVSAGKNATKKVQQRSLLRYLKVTAFSMHISYFIFSNKQKTIMKDGINRSEAWYSLNNVYILLSDILYQETGFG